MEKYKNDGIIWYFENYGYTNEEIARTLWRFKDNGYFKFTKGIIFGRSRVNESCYNIEYEDVIKDSLKDLDIPIILDADFGHLAPRMTIINGAIATINAENGKGSIKFELI